MDARATIGGVAGLLSLAGFAPYLAAIHRREIRPQRATWWIWTIVGALIVASSYAAGARRSLWVPIAYAVGPLVVALASLRHGEGGWRRLDRGCIALAAGSLVVWYATGDPRVALVAQVAVDLFGALPTLLAVFRDPASEDRRAWALFCAGNALNLVAARPFTVGTALHPAYMTALTATVLALALRRRAA